MINERKFQLKKDGTCKSITFCKNPEMIENYNLAIADKERTWICHHKLEAFYTKDELKEMGRYYNIPAKELVFVRDEKEHQSWPHKGYTCEETKRKRSEALKGKQGHPQSEETRRKISESRKVRIQCVETGQIFESIRAASNFIGHIMEARKIDNPNYTISGYHWSRI